MLILVLHEIGLFNMHSNWQLNLPHEMKQKSNERKIRRNYYQKKIGRKQICVSNLRKTVRRVRCSTVDVERFAETASVEATS